MKKRILFVDDEINILKSLKRMLRPMRDQWAMEFALGPHNALHVLKKEMFDVIVTDMRMPNMDGAKLLDIVKKKYPGTVRIILSGHSDQESVMKSVKTAHQYLPKPCKKEVLINTVSRSLALKEVLNQAHLLELVGCIESMPSLPVLYGQLVEELRSPSASSSSVGNIISEDMGMTAKVLQLVNSSFFGMPRHVSSATEAVTMLGIDIMKALVLGIEVFSMINEKSLVESVAKIHNHCVKTGAIAREIATLEKMGKHDIDNAVIASMLHDIGKLILIEHFPDKYNEVISLVIDKHLAAHEAENEIFCVSHALVGAHLLGLWGFPDAVVEAVAFHHCPGDSRSKGLDLAGVVYVADIMEYHEQYQKGTWQRLSGVNEAYLKACGVTDRVLLWRDFLRTTRQ